MQEVGAGNVPNIGIRATACMRKVVNFTECRHDTKKAKRARGNGAGADNTPNAGRG